MLCIVYHACSLGTQTPELDSESSVAELYQKALFLPRSSLQNLEEIGEG